jgi:hypothetical protein
MANILVGAAIILVPLVLFLFVMVRDLSSEEDGLMRRVAKLQKRYSSMKFGTRGGSSMADGTYLDEDNAYLDEGSTDLDEDDAKLIQNIASKLKTDNVKAGSLASAFNKAIRIRDSERIVLNRKIKNFKMYSIMIILLICASLGFLLFLSDLNL